MRYECYAFFKFYINTSFWRLKKIILASSKEEKMEYLDHWIEVCLEKKREIDDLILVFHSNPWEELRAEISKKMEDINAFIDSLKEQGYMVALENKDPIAAPQE